MAAPAINRRQSRQCALALAGMLLRFAALDGQADIIHEEFEIPTTNGFPVIGLPSNPFLLDLDKNGTTDFIFQAGSEGFAVFPQAGAAVLAMPAGPLDLNSYALPLSAGEAISSLTPVGAFWDTDGVYGSLLTSARDAGAIGLFTGQIAYLGVQFTRDDQSHYGWLYLDVSYVGLNTGNFLGYGWEDIPGLGITAGAVPEPATWALLAMGALAFAAVRKRKKR